MSIADKLAIIAENEQKVYNAGFKEGKAILDLTTSINATKENITNIVNSLSLSPGIHNPTVVFNKAVINDLFPDKNLITPESFEYSSKTECGLTIMNNGDGSFTINGTYDGTQSGGNYTYWLELIGTTLPSVYGIYRFELEGEDRNYIERPYATINGDEFPFISVDPVTPSNDPFVITISILPNKQINNLVIRPKIIYSEWETLTWDSGHTWNFQLV